LVRPLLWRSSDNCSGGCLFQAQHLKAPWAVDLHPVIACMHVTICALPSMLYCENLQAALQPMSWGLGPVAECDPLEATTRDVSADALHKQLTDPGSLSCHSSLSQSHLLAGSWAGSAMGIAFAASSTTASRPAVGWLMVLTLAVVAGLGTLSLMMATG